MARKLLNVVRVYKGPDGETALDFIQADGKVYQLQPLPEMDELKPGYYTRDFKFITGHPPPESMMPKKKLGVGKGRTRRWQ